MLPRIRTWFLFELEAALGTRYMRDADEELEGAVYEGGRWWRFWITILKEWAKIK